MTIPAMELKRAKDLGNVTFYSTCRNVETYFDQRLLLSNTIFNIWMHFICVNAIHKFLFCLQGF
jgi:hypothetical protein